MQDDITDRIYQQAQVSYDYWLENRCACGGVHLYWECPLILDIPQVWEAEWYQADDYMEVE